MKVTGTATLDAPVEQVWQALNDPDVLVRTIPGCSQLEETGPDAYRMTVTMGVASIKGTYLGEVRLSEQQPPSSFLLHASGAGGPGTVDADVRVTLAAEGAGTRLSYDADAAVGGVIGGVGQRMLVGVAKRTAGEFFAAVDDVLAGGDAEAEASAAASDDGSTPGVHTAPARSRSATAGAPPIAAAVAGAVIALAGVLLGWTLGRRR